MTKLTKMNIFICKVHLCANVWTVAKGSKRITLNSTNVEEGFIFGINSQFYNYKESFDKISQFLLTVFQRIRVQCIVIV